MQDFHVSEAPEYGDEVEVDEVTGELLDDEYEDPSALEDCKPLNFND